ncbi:hypothetical protein GBA52_014037 [Prunus armeniaca]|nr:hypothetical protein GBA52_014037 [Prunus armeniaca]
MPPVGPRSGDAIFANVERVVSETPTPLMRSCLLTYGVIVRQLLTDLEEVEEIGFKMFLGVTASVTNWDADGTCCSIVLEDNPLVDFVELPDTCQGLYYCNILSGVVRGALEMELYFLTQLYPVVDLVPLQT